VATKDNDADVFTKNTAGATNNRHTAKFLSDEGRTLKQVHFK
jgi:hypothetical protein